MDFIGKQFALRNICARNCTRAERCLAGLDFPCCSENSDEAPTPESYLALTQAMGGNGREQRRSSPNKLNP